MKYGALFSTLCAMLVYYAITSGGLFLLLLWPAVSIGIVGLGYLVLAHRVFGKRPDGSTALASTLLLLP
ncbi:MAG: hypothetical protein AAF483_25160 [Planctomycetota bacterium]